MAPATALRLSEPEPSTPDKSSIVPIELTKLESQRLRVVHAAWEQWRGSRTMPARTDISLRSLGNAAANVCLVRLLPDRSDY